MAPPSTTSPLQSISGRPAVRVLTAGLLAAAALVVPAGLAHADPGLPNPVPNPEPGAVGAESSVPAATVGCPAGETYEGGNCVAAMTSPATGGEIRVSAPQVGTGSAASSSTSSYLDPTNTVPSINGDPCTGAWESSACYAMNFDAPPGVQPRSTISASP